MNTYLSSLHYQKATRQRTRSLRRNSNIGTRAVRERGLGPISNILFVATIFLITGLLYLGQVTKSNDYSFTISELETQKQELIEQNQALEIEAARLSSIDRVKASDLAKSLENPQSVDFVR